MKAPYHFRHKSWNQKLLDHIKDWRDHTYSKQSRMPLFVKVWLVLIVLVGTLTALYVLQASTELRKKATLEDDSYPLLVEIVQDRSTGQIRVKNASYTTFQPALVTDEGNAPYTLSTYINNQSIDSQPLEFVDSVPVDDFEVLLGKDKESITPQEYVLPERTAIIVIRYTPEAQLELTNNQDNGQIPLDNMRLDTMLGAPPRSKHNIMAPSRNTLDITFVSSNYQDFNQYHSDVDAMVAKLFDTYPFDAYQDYIAIHKVENHTDLGCYRPNTIPRLILCDRHKIIQAVSNTPYDTIVVVENSNEYGGAGYLPTSNLPGITVTYSDITAQAREIFVHEFGHSFGQLSDEYNRGRTYIGSNPPWPNCDISPTCGKWSNHPEAECHQVCDYTNLYRPTYNDSIMRTLNPSHGWQFGPVSEEALRNRLQLYTPLTADLDRDGDVDFIDYSRSIEFDQIQLIISDYGSQI